MPPEAPYEFKNLAPDRQKLPFWDEELDSYRRALHDRLRDLDWVTGWFKEKSSSNCWLTEEHRGTCFAIRMLEVDIRVMTMCCDFCEAQREVVRKALALKEAK